MLYPKITSAKIIENYTLLVHFSNHQARKYNCENLLEKTMFSSLKNYQLDPSGSGIVWNDEVDISEYEIWINGIEL
jgi:hypothetical protein